MKLFGSRKKIATVSINMRPARGPWGGSSAFVDQFEHFMRARGWRVDYALSPQTKVIIIVDPRDDLQNKAFGMDAIRAHLSRFPDVKVLHRVNECDQRKATSFMDNILKNANTLADHTVFISGWLKQYFTDRWFNEAKPHSVIYNGADTAVFHPIGAVKYSGDGTFRIVTHHWSDNPMKGFDAYVELDNMIASGCLPDVELTMIGRWPRDIRWKSAILVPPLSGIALASKLRQSHAYITASLWEPCGMHHVEGAQCGLPLIYHEDGGGIVEAGRKYGIDFRQNMSDAVISMKDRYLYYRAKLLQNMPSGDRMCIEYAEVLQRLLVN